MLETKEYEYINANPHRIDKCIIHRDPSIADITFGRKFERQGGYKYLLNLEIAGKD